MCVAQIKKYVHFDSTIALSGNGFRKSKQQLEKKKKR